jgi:branched-chain amino acid transport system permease protein
MNGRAQLVSGVLGVALILLLSWWAPWLRFVLTIAVAKGIAVLGILVLLRGGQVSFGHAMFVAVSAYMAAFAAGTVRDALVLVPLAAATAALLGLVVGVFVMRYRDIFFGMLNLALSMVFYSMLDKFYSITRGSDGIRLPPITIAGLALTGDAYQWALLAMALVLAAAFAVLVQINLASPLGHALAGIKTREARLEFMGMPGRPVLLVAYVLSALMAGTAGVLIALASGQVTPALAYWTSSGELVFIAVLGGASSVLGPFLGAAVYELTRVYASALVANTWQMVLGLVLLAVILFAPGGLIALLGRVLRRRPA